MVACGLLQTILPEITVNSGKKFSDHSSGVSGFDHILAAYSDLEKRQLDSSAILTIEKVSDKQPSINVPFGLLKFALFLKDLAKPPLSNLGKRNSLSNRPTDPIYQRLKLSNREKNYIEFIVLNYQKLLTLFTSFQKEQLSDTAVTRLFMLSGDDLPDLILYVQSIVTSGTNHTTEQKKNFSIFAQILLKRFYSVFIPISVTPPLLTGEDLISYFNMPPSPIFKFLLDTVETDRLAGRIQTRDEALELVDQLLMEKQIKF